MLENRARGEGVRVEGGVSGASKVEGREGGEPGEDFGRRGGGEEEPYWAFQVLLDRTLVNKQIHSADDRRDERG